MQKLFFFTLLVLSNWLIGMEIGAENIFYSAKYNDLKKQEIIPLITHVINNFPADFREEFYRRTVSVILKGPQKPIFEEIFTNENIELLGLEEHPLVIAIISKWQSLDELVSLAKSTGKLNAKIGKIEFTPLAIAVLKNREDAVSKLIDAGADVNAIDKAGRSVLMNAIKSTPKIILLLLNQEKINVAYRSRIGISFIEQAIIENSDVLESIAQHPKILQVLNLADDEGNTPLMLAIEANKINLVKIFVQNGANLNVADKRGITPLISAICRCPKIALILIKYIMNMKDKEEKSKILNAIDTEGNCALIYGSQLNNGEFMKSRLISMLIKAGADIGIVKDKEMRTKIIFIYDKYNKIAQSYFDQSDYELDIDSGEENIIFKK